MADGNDDIAGVGEGGGGEGGGGEGGDEGLRDGDIDRGDPAGFLPGDPVPEDPEPAEPPEITEVQPGQGGAGIDVTILGFRFGATGTVRFVPVGGGFSGATATTSTWTSSRIVARVPGVAAIGTPGEIELRVTTGGQLASIGWVLVGSTPPAVTGFNRAMAPPGDELVLLGHDFGVGAAGQSVLFRTGPSDPGVAAPVVSCRPTEIRVVVPDAGFGARTVVVQTPWGSATAPGSFTVAPRPVIGGVFPAESVPDARITITGAGFGTNPALGVVLRYDPPGAPPAFDVGLEIESWTPTEIRAFVPGLAPLRVSGAKQLIVRTDVAASAPATFTVLDIGSITTWTRIEPHARDEDRERTLQTGLAAEIADPLWLLARQWVLGELQATDGGSPVQAVVDGEAVPLGRWRPGAGAAAEIPRTGGAPPLEALVERERVVPPAGPTAAFPDRRLAAEAGLQLLRHLDIRVPDAAQAAAYRRAFIDAYPLGLPPQTELARLDPASRRFLDVMAGRAPDGEALYRTLRRGQVPARPTIRSQDTAAVLAVIDDWLGWCETMISQPAAGVTAWDSQRMEYAFAVAAETAVGEVVMAAPEYADGRLDWHAFVRRPGESLRAGTPAVRAPVAVGGSFTPSPVGFPGMPLPRWWEMEDRRVDFGGLQAGASELLRMLLIEFATVFGNDWFAVPIAGVPAGSLVRLSSVRVRDAFGVETAVPPFSTTAPGGGWRMYELAAADGTVAPDLLLVPPTVNGGFESAPIERVLLARDELANMAWAIEQVVASATGRPLDRHEAHQAERHREELADGDAGAPPSPVPAPAVVPEVAYRLAKIPPPQWIPLVPDTGGTVRKLARASFRDPGGGPSGGTPILPQGRLLEPGSPLSIHDAEVPRSGVELVRSWQVARSSDGSTHLWLGRRKQSGQGDTSSGLRFDDIEANPPPVPAPPRSIELPQIGGPAQSTRTLSASTGTWAGSVPLAYTYRWRRCDAGGGTCADVPGATGPTLALTATHIGSTFRVVVTATNAAGSASATSAATALVVAFGTPAATAPPVVSGRAAVGSTLSATAGTWTGTAPLTLAYQWRRGGVDIPGATAVTYVPVEADEGFVLRVVVIATNSVSAVSATSAATAPVVGPPHSLTPPAISGAAVSGQTLSVTPGTWSNQPTQFAYQWRRGTTDLAGATAATYRVTTADAGSVLRVVVRAGNAVGTTAATSPPTATVVSPPAMSAAPAVTGWAVAGQQLTATPGTWSGTAPITFAYQWSRGSTTAVDIAGATAATYTATPADVGSPLRVRVTASNTGGSGSAVSAPTAAVVAPVAPASTAPPTVSGTAEVGVALTATTGAWTGTNPLTFAFRWRAVRAGGGGGAGTEIPGATAATYTPVDADVGATLRATVTATNPSGAATASSAPTAAVVPPQRPANVLPPAISGTLVVGELLTAFRGTWTSASPVTFGYQWVRCDAEGKNDVEIDGAKEAKYVLTPEDIGSTLRVVVTAENRVGATSEKSPLTAVVAKSPPADQPK